MSFFVNAFNTLLYKPLFNALVFLCQYLPGHDFGVAIIVLTFLIKILLYPLGVQSVKSQKTLSNLQPKIKEVQEKYKNDKEKQLKETMALYKQEKVNPFAGCLPLLIQLPILLALYRVFWRGFRPEQSVYLYGFLSHAGPINPTFLGLINLAQPSLYLAILAGVLQFFQTKMVSPKFKNRGAKDGKFDFSGAMQKQSLYLLPIFTVLVLFKLPSAIGLYMAFTTLFTIIQQYFVLKPPQKNSALPPA